MRRRSSTTVKQSPADGEQPWLLVLPDGGQGPIRTEPLPLRGTLIVGRGSSVDVFIDHPSVSRRHLSIEIADDQIFVEDLGSANGTRVRGAAIVAHERVMVAFGEAIEVGEAIVVAKRRRAAAVVPLLPHDYFEARLVEACNSADRRRTTFVVMRVRGATREELGELTTRAACVADYGAGELELLLLDCKIAEAETLAAALTRSHPRTTVGIAGFPVDGQSADALIECAGAVGVQPSLMERQRDLVARAAASELTILIHGETGAGKEVLAEAVHRQSPRAGKPFLKLNMAAIAETLLESELFGHEKGAFTGAVRAKPGLLETADGGTVFLDEIGDLSPALQAKLLRVLEERRVWRVGALQSRPIDVRFIAATHRDLEIAVADGAFRQDLYFRLCGFSLVVPPLRERRDEIGPLAKLFIERAAAQYKRKVVRVGAAAMAELVGYSWPGNIRELKNAIERAVCLCDGGELGPEHLPLDKMRRAPQTAAPTDERGRIIAALDACAGNQTHAARMLGISRGTLVTRLAEYNLPRPRKH